MNVYDRAQKRNAEWNGNPADYPWWEPSPELAAAIESQGSDDDIIPDGHTREEILEDCTYDEQKIYLKGMPKEVWDYRGTLPRVFGESEHGPHSITCTHQNADPTDPWYGPEMKVSTEDETLVISMRVLGRSTRELIQVRISPRDHVDQPEDRTKPPGSLSGKNDT